MDRRHRILYLEHSEIIGGSNVSLKELLIDAKAKGYDCHVICAHEVIANVYKDLGITTYLAPLASFSHNTAWFYKLNLLDLLRMMKIALKTVISFVKIYRLIKSIKPDVVHLNSSVLIFYTFYFKLLGFPNILHIRENIVRGYFGLRKSLVRWMANRFATYVIYISEHELTLLATKPAKSVVVYNYIHEENFVPKERANNTYYGETLVLLSLGGLFELKGGKKILEALKSVGRNVKVVLVGTADPRIDPHYLSMVNSEAYTKEVIELLNDPEISSKVELIDKVRDPATYIDRAHALIFWADRPHFPRTVFEAWILKRPVVYHNPGFENAIINSNTVLEVKENDAAQLAKAMNDLPKTDIFQAPSVQKCYDLAKANFTERNFNKIDDIYRRCIERE